MSDRITALELQEQELVLRRFDLEDAWRLGARIVDIAFREGFGVGIDIRRANQVLFRAMLPGTAPDQEEWIEKKAALVLRMESSGALVEARHRAAGIDAASFGWLPSDSYAITGGSFPIRVRGVGVVAAVTASGLSSEDDHDLIVRGIRAHLLEETNA
ncbi:heme-degrading domain-containing protein [Curtobacterium sp. ISL-83]|uniref:heme-degrading domain-containing protein n=1 Tax=Curtobacterium sp. ISL-83 TaxID=2819145 RepID=UPI001BE5B639|nr:heme-degrading domain-containing protein [Curtobacterium sp. ISL-83]MBT2501723.1 heme-degrading domain-containing protein [Curtobacterium sp. ISL-83]